MIKMLVIFAVSLAVLHGVDLASGRRPTWFGLPRTYMKVNLALLGALGTTVEQQLVGAPRNLVFGGVVVLALLDALWAAYLGRRMIKR